MKKPPCGGFAGNPNGEDITVPVFINLDTGHREIASFNNLRIQGKMKLIGYGNLENPKFNQIRQLMDAELHSSPKVEEYVSLMQQKVSKEQERAKERATK